MRASGSKVRLIIILLCREYCPLRIIRRHEIFGMYWHKGVQSIPRSQWRRSTRSVREPNSPSIFSIQSPYFYKYALLVSGRPNTVVMGGCGTLHVARPHKPSKRLMILTSKCPTNTSKCSPTWHTSTGPPLLVLDHVTSFSTSKFVHDASLPPIPNCTRDTRVGRMIRLVRDSASFSK